MKKLTQSLENYLFAVFEIVQENSAARVKDVANRLNIGMASTSEAIKALSKKGYINYIPYGIITLTTKGKKAVSEKIKRHSIICNFLEKCLLLEQDEIDEAADSIEFSMPENLLNRFVEYLTFMQNCSCKEPKWVKSFQYYLENGKMQKKCNDCIKNKSKFDNSKCCGCGSVDK